MHNDPQWCLFECKTKDHLQTISISNSIQNSSLKSQDNRTNRRVINGTTALRNDRRYRNGSTVSFSEQKDFSASVPVHSSEPSSSSLSLPPERISKPLSNPLGNSVFLRSRGDSLLSRASLLRSSR